MMQQRTSIPQMVAESRDVISNPSVSTFERYEHRGTIADSAIYIGIAALIAALLSFSLGPIGMIGSAISTVISFFIFTGLVYFIGRQMGGTGNFSEVAYTFSLFSAPLYVIGGLIALLMLLFAWVPILNVIVGLIGVIVALGILVVQIYFGYLAVQSSMNISDTGRAIITLVLAAIGSLIVRVLVGGIFGI
ncbi:YIP1 family protein [Candidatus Gracilibacteria bacterium]|nr:YIP1 family protein [Candidatus Gracilibacteria bacterium]